MTSKAAVVGSAVAVPVVACFVLAEVFAVGVAAVVVVRLEEHVVAAVALVVGCIATAAGLLAVVGTVQSVGCVAAGTVQMVGRVVAGTVQMVELAATVALLEVGSAAAVALLEVESAVAVAALVVGVDWTAAAEAPAAGCYAAALGPACETSAQTVVCIAVSAVQLAEYAGVVAVPAARFVGSVLTPDFAAALELEVAFLGNPAIAVAAAALVVSQLVHPLGPQLLVLVLHCGFDPRSTPPSG